LIWWRPGKNPIIGPETGSLVYRLVRKYEKGGFRFNQVLPVNFIKGFTVNLPVYAHLLSIYL